MFLKPGLLTSGESEAVQFVGQVLQPVICLGDGGRTEGVRLDDVRSCVHRRFVDVPDYLWLRDREQVVVAPQLYWMIGEALPAIVPFGEPVGLDHGPHGTV